MERREFLKVLGLGGIALTLPKPAGIVVARLAELEAPPLHVGRVEIGPLTDAERQFVMRKISIGVERDITADRYKDYCENWVLTAMSKMTVGSTVTRKLMIKTLAYHLAEYDIHLEREAPIVNFPMTAAYLFAPSETMEFWFTPAEGHLPMFPLPPLSVVLHGHMVYKRETQVTGRDYVLGGRVLGMSMFGKVSTMQLERTRAIELGLSSPSEEEGIIA